MNINTMIEMINNFNQTVVESGFQRDIQEYIATIAQPQNSQNIVLLKDIATKTNESLKSILNSDLPDILKILIPVNQENIFTNSNHSEIIDKLLSDPQINTSQFHAQLTQTLNNIITQIKNNKNTINQLSSILTPYYNYQADKDKLQKRAVISLIFKNIDTVTNLKKFASSLTKWNRTIHLYHQLVSSKSPKDVELLNIQNGSLDVIINMDVNVAINFTEIVKYGLQAFGGYLLYKSSIKEIVKAYLGNKKLIKAEREREQELLNNVGIVIEAKINEQYKKILTGDSLLKPDNPTKIASEVTKTIAEHIVLGNDIKLLIKTDSEKTVNLITEINKESLTVRNELKKLSSDDKKLLLDQYTIKEEDKKEEPKSKKKSKILRNGNKE